MAPRLLPSRQWAQKTVVSLRLSSRRSFHPDRTIQANDTVLLKQGSSRKAQWRYIRPLSPQTKSADHKIKLAYGAHISTRDLVGRKFLDVVKDSRGNDVTIYEPSLANHVHGMPRAATPIYPHDAQTIVNMMDLHFDPPDDSDEPFEVFEAGTGAGSLTIHIARALSAANPALPSELRETIYVNILRSSPERTFLFPEDRHVANSPGRNILNINWPTDNLSSLAETYIMKRRAVLHTLDYKSPHTRSAQDLFRSFRRGLYLPHVDFHVGTISSYLIPRLADRSGRPFLSRAVLDLPTAETEAGSIIHCLHPNGTLIIFSPSISQIGNFIQWSTTTNQPLRLDRVTELPTSTTGSYGVGENEGGRSWKVQTVQPKVYRADKTGREHKEGERENKQEPVQVMRPKVGEAVCGGGFVAVLRKVRVGQSGSAQESGKEYGLASVASLLEKHLQDVRNSTETRAEETDVKDLEKPNETETNGTESVQTGAEKKDDK